MTNKRELVRAIYLYLFSLLGLVLITIGLVRIVDLGLKTYIFKKADQAYIYPEYPIRVRAPGEEVQALTKEEQEEYDEKRVAAEEANREGRRQRTASNSLAMIIIGTPLFLYHWKTIQKDKESK